MTDEVRYRLRQQAAVAEMGQRALVSTDLTRLMHEATALVAMGLNVELSKVLELLPNGESLLLKAGVGWKEGIVGNVTVGADTDSQAGYTLKIHEPVIVEDLRSEERFRGPPLLVEHDVVSGLSTIISGKERDYGVLGAHTRSKRVFTGDDINFLVAVANILAAAVERQRMENELKDAEERYRTLVETSPDAIVFTGLDTEILLCNRQAARMVGYDSADEVLGKRVIDFVVVEEKKQAFKALKDIVNAGKTANLEIMFQRVDGGRTPVEISASLLKDKKGRAKAIIGICRDITGRRQTEVVLRNIAEGVSGVTGETFFRTLVEYLARSLEMDFAFIGEMIEEREIKTIAVFKDGEIIDNFEYNLADTPCHDVVQKGICSYPTNVAKRFPKDKMLAEMGIESYIGTPLTDSAGHTQGVMSVLGRKHIENTKLAESMLRIFAVRASAELERKQAEEEIRLLHSLTAAINEADTLDDALSITMKKICDVTGWLLGEVWMPSADGGVLEKEISWHAVEDGFKKFGRESMEFTFKPGEGIPGRVWASREPVWIKDVTKDKNFLRTKNAKKIGLKAGVGIPILENGGVVAVMDFFVKEAREEEGRFIDLVSTAAGQLGSVIQKKRADEQVKDSVRRLQSALSGVIGALASTVERRDPYTAGHQQRVAKLGAALAAEMGLSEERVEGLRMAGTLHDLGKIAVPAEILSKPGTISEYEFSIIKNHPQIGYEILKEIEFPWDIARIVHEHHERIDGSGYPQGLSGEDIMLEARIMAVADTVEAMASHRPYRPSLGMKAALEEIQKYKGRLYDKDAVDACVCLCYEKGYEL